MAGRTRRARPRRGHGGIRAGDVGEGMEIATDLVTALAGYRVDALALEVVALAARAVDGAIGNETLAPGAVEVAGRGDVPVSVPSERRRHDCPLGGQLGIERVRADFDESDYSHTVAIDRYVFDQCRVAVAETPSAGDPQVIDGVLATREVDRSGNRFQDSSASSTWSAFTLSGPGGREARVDGEVERYEFSSYASSTSRKVRLAEYGDTGGADGPRASSDVALDLSEGYDTTSGVSTFGLSASGTVLDPVTDGVAVSIATAVPFERAVPPAAAPTDVSAVPFRGAMRLDAGERGTLELNADPGDTDPGSLRVDYVWTGPDGDTRRGTARPFARLGAYAEAGTGG